MPEQRKQFHCEIDLIEHGSFILNSKQSNDIFHSFTMENELMESCDK